MNKTARKITLGIAIGVVYPIACYFGWLELAKLAMGKISD